MKSLLSILSVLVFFFISNVFAQDSLQIQNKNQYRIKNQTKTANQNQPRTQNKMKFVDENGDGYNDNAPDQDGDGIPNGRDDDYAGSKFRKGNNSKGFVDIDGDGINDNALDSDGDGIPNGQDPDYERPLDGSGQKNRNGNNRQGLKRAGNSSGAGIGAGSGDCDGRNPPR